MENELIIVVMGMFGALFSGLQLFQIKRIADLCERITRLETELKIIVREDRKAQRLGALIG